MLYLWSFRQNLNNNIKQIIMKKIFETPARGGQTYESPKLETLDLTIEGVICASGDYEADPADWTPGANNWFVD